jgi:hypothetical protein
MADLPVYYSGSKHQSGFGLSNFLLSTLRRVIPLAIKIAKSDGVKHVGKKLYKKTVNVIQDMSKKRKFGESLEHHGIDFANEMVDDTIDYAGKKAKKLVKISKRPGSGRGLSELPLPSSFNDGSQLIGLMKCKKNRQTGRFEPKKTKTKQKKMTMRNKKKKRQLLTN